MKNKIIVYGHADKSIKHGFPTEDGLIEYLQRKLFTEHRGRHCFTQNKEADVVVVSRKGLAYGHLNVEDIEDPTLQDKKEYPKVKKVYIIRFSTVYNTPVRLYDIGIRGLSHGKLITYRQFNEIKSRAHGLEEYWCLSE